MLRTFKTLTIATAILSLFFLFLTSSEAFEISQMYPSYGGYEDHTGSLYHTAYVETDTPYLYVYWYIDDVYQSISGGPSTSASFSPNSSDFPGNHDGITYTIKAVAYQYDAENDVILSDSDSYSVTVYAACRETAASLTASVTSCSWNGRTASATSFATVNHTGGENAPSVTYVLNFGFEVYRLQADGKRAEDVFKAKPERSQGTVNAGDAKITKSYSESYTLGNGWDQDDTFEVYTRATAWAINNERGAEGKECMDEDSDTFTIPRN